MLLKRFININPRLCKLDISKRKIITINMSELVNENTTKVESNNNSIGPLPIVVAGPSGVGKGTLIKLLMDKYPDLFGFSVSHCTRAPRPGEINGVHYNFVSVPEIEKAIENNEFIEYAQVHTNYYGTSIEAVEKVKSKGKICILDIDVQGVRSVKKSSLVCKYVFIMPPSIDELKSRLIGRGTETEEKISIRLNNSIEEINFGKEEGNFDAIITNSDLNTSFANLLDTIKNWYPEFKF